MTTISVLYPVLTGLASTNVLYPVLSSGGGTPGPPGPPGSPGSVWYNGTGIPSNSLGIDGDYYYRYTTGDIYFKIGGSW